MGYWSGRHIAGAGQDPQSHKKLQITVSGSYKLGRETPNWASQVLEKKALAFGFEFG
jgi:hypothetical protein